VEKDLFLLMAIGEKPIPKMGYNPLNCNSFLSRIVNGRLNTALFITILFGEKFSLTAYVDL